MASTKVEALADKSMAGLWPWGAEAARVGGTTANQVGKAVEKEGGGVAKGSRCWCQSTYCH